MIPKFRGFRTKAEEWVEGNLIYREEPYQHDIVTPIGNSSTISYAVERDSIGQWTGLKDQNGVEIYEGDIVKLTEKTINGGIDTHTCKVFQSKSGAWRLEGHPDFSRKYTTKRELYSVRSRIEVIGNIYENPELLEVAE